MAKFLHLLMIFIDFVLVEDVCRHSEQREQMAVLNSNVVTIEAIEKGEKIIGCKQERFPLLMAGDIRGRPCGLYQDDARAVSAPICTLKYFLFVTLDIDLEKIDCAPGMLLTHPCERCNRDRTFHQIEPLSAQLAASAYASEKVESSGDTGHSKSVEIPHSLTGPCGD